MLKNKLPTILMVLGIIIMAVSGYILLEWKFVQQDSGVLVNEVSDFEEDVEEKPVYGLAADLKETEKKAMLEMYEEAMLEMGEEVYIYKTSKEELEDGMMSIVIPKLNVAAEVMNGTSKSQLKKGPGLYDMSPLVYEFNANVLIAGHRTTYGKWFRNVDKLTEGDPIIINFENHDFLYEVEKVFIVQHNDWSVTEPQGYSALTLTACHPLYSAKQRIVVRAKLVETKENITD